MGRAQRRIGGLIAAGSSRRNGQPSFLGGRPGARPTLEGMSLLERVQSDITAAMKSGERGRVGALRLVSSELQKAHKEAASGSQADEVAGPPRERKRPGRGGTPPPPARGGDPPPAPGGQGERSDAPPPPPPPPHA